jgi:hypothetical protein
MSSHYQQDPTGQASIWLVRAAGEPERDVVAFWERIDAEAYAESRGAANPGQASVLSELVVQGGRRRCQLCGEPIVLDDLSDAESWRHAGDANDLGDHTAEV